MLTVSWFSDPTKETKLTLADITSIYGDKIDTLDMVIKPFTMDDSQRYATIV